MRRRRFIATLGLGAIGLAILAFFLRSRVALLQKKLAAIGFKVEREEVHLFWRAWMDQKWGARDRIWKYYVLIGLEYLQEPRDETVRMFLLSSNALQAKEGEKIRFEGLYHPYKKVCGHPFAVQ